MSNREIRSAWHLAVLGLGTLGTAHPAAAAPPQPASYAFAWQAPFGSPPTYNVTGPATGASPDGDGDGFLQSVAYSDGQEYLYFYRPVAVTDLTFSSDSNANFAVAGGTNITIGDPGVFAIGDPDGNPGDVTAYDIAIFETKVLYALGNRNLNSYPMVTKDWTDFSFIVEFEQEVRDNDPGPDDLGELLYFERGIDTTSANSWIKMQAVDADGNALGPWLVISPAETVGTTPLTYTGMAWIYETYMSGTAIDVSRLGVTEFKYLKVANVEAGDPGYTSGGDLNPDFKLMFVVTDPLDIGLAGSCD